MISIDTECGGVDHFHGATTPFFVTTADDAGNIRSWEWRVNPLTREVEVEREDVEAIREVVASADEIVGQNVKYDVQALEQSGIITDWPWEKTHCTLMASHLLASNHPHDLTSLALEYLGVNIAPQEEKLHEACNAARRLARSKYPDWRIAKEGDPMLPSAKGGKDKSDRGVQSESPWAFDMWLPRALAEAADLPLTHPWWTALSEYSNMDSAVTLPLWRAIEKSLHERSLWKIYEHRRKLPRVAMCLERRGITVNKPRLNGLRDKFRQEAMDASKACVSIAASYTAQLCPVCRQISGASANKDLCKCKKKPPTQELPYELELPKGAVNDNLRAFCFDVMQLEHVVSAKAKTSNPTLDAKQAIPHYMATLPVDSKPYQFIASFAERNGYNTAISYLTGYERYWLPYGDDAQEFMVLHPSYNPTGTDHLRWSSSNPNAQNSGKQSSACKRCKGDGCERCNHTGLGKVSLRECFGPAPGREWWSLDAKNIERRMVAFPANEVEVIELLEHPERPPYYGSEHNLIGSIIFPKEFASCRDEKGNVDGRIFKKRYGNGPYQRTKNFGFAKQYRCGRETGDRTSGVPGSWDMVAARYASQEAFNDKIMAFANKHGYVETLPDSEVDPERGYPILVTRGNWGRVKPTEPLNYFGSGSAMWWMSRAQCKVQEFFDSLNAKLPPPQFFITIQQHDELVIDLPKKADPRKNPKGSNLSVVKEVKRLMESCGPPIGVPTPVSCDYHPVSWSEGYSVA